MSTLRKEEIHFLDQVDEMRKIYNECLPFLSTKPLPPRTRREQEAWWLSLDPKKVKAFLYYPTEGRQVPVAFSLVQWKPDKVTPMFGITESARGNNYAREIIEHYLEVAGGPLEGEVLESHKAILRLNEEAGWEISHTKDGVVYMSHPNKQNYPDYQAIVDYETS